jgi:hypothetical protein
MENNFVKTYLSKIAYTSKLNKTISPILLKKEMLEMPHEEKKYHIQ